MCVQAPHLLCKSCGNEGHARKDCPEEIVPPLVEIRQPSKLSLECLKTVIYNNFGKLVSRYCPVFVLFIVLIIQGVLFSQA